MEAELRSKLFTFYKDLQDVNRTAIYLPRAMDGPMLKLPQLTTEQELCRQCYLHAYEGILNQLEELFPELPKMLAEYREAKETNVHPEA